MKKIYILFFILILFGKLQAQTWDGSVSDDWDNMNNWTPANVPTATSVVSIPGGLMGVPYPKLATDVTIKSIIMTTGSSLDFNGKVLNINNLATYPQIVGATLNNTDAATDIVINLDAGGGGYDVFFSSNIVNDVITINLSGSNNFYEGYSAAINDYNFDATFNLNGTNSVFLSYISGSNYDGNLTINRTVAGTTNVFYGGNTVIDGNFSLNNLMTGGPNNIGNTTTATTIVGKVDININYPTKSAFNLNKIENTGVGGVINVVNSLGYDINSNKLVVNSLSVSEMGGSQYGYFRNNIISGNVNLSDASTYGAGYAVYITNNKITGASLFINNGTNVLNETNGANSANEFIGETTFNATSTGTLNISEADNSIFTGNLNINRTAAGTTNAFSAAPTISGNFNYTNNFGGNTEFGHVTDITLISGEINISAIYQAVATFEMLSISNVAIGMASIIGNKSQKVAAPLAGGTISVIGSRGFNVQKNNLDLALFSITDYQGNGYGYFFNNTMVGDLILTDNPSYTGGYTTTLRSNTITGATTITVLGTNVFEEADVAATANHFIGNVIINGNSVATLSLSKLDDSIFDGNLTINRTSTAGVTDAFNAQGTINGNFTYINNIGGNFLLGHPTLPTVITGTINITDTYPTMTPASFEMTTIQNQTNGGSIMVQNSRGFDIRNSNLKVVDLSITGYRSNDYGYLFSNTIQGNVNLADDASYAGGYNTTLRSNTITGLTNITINGSNTFEEADLAISANHYIGNTIITGNSSATLYISKTDNSIFDGNLTINRTGSAGTTDAFNGQATINGNFTYINNIGGNSYFGKSNALTTITGTINMTATYLAPASFELSFIENQTNGGSITVVDSRGFDIRNCILKVAALSINGYRANDYGYLIDNEIEGDVTIADHSSYGGGYATNLRNNMITGNSTFTNNGSNQFHDGNGASYSNKYIGNVTYNKTGATMNIATSSAFNEYSGNLTLNSTSGIGTGLLKFNGSTNSVIEQLGSQAIIIEQLIVEKTNPGKVFLADPIVISSSLTLTTGNIVASATNLLTLNDNVTATGGSSASFVEGPLAKKGNDIFTFPIGKDTKYGPISITAPASATTSLFTAEYKDNNPTIDGYNITQKAMTLDHILAQEYWLIDGNSPVFVTLGWDATRSGQVNPLTSARVAHWNSTTNTWEDKGNSATTGNPNIGTVKTGAAISSFSPFAIASIEPFVPLPLNLISFTGKNTENGNELIWQTADEKAFSHFEIERSSDAKKFEKIGELKGSKSEIYEFTDSQNSSNISHLLAHFYRLKMVDIDGKFNYSKIIFIENKIEKYVNIYPNPAYDYFSITGKIENASLQILNISGKKEKDFELNMANKYSIYDLPKGIYYVKIINGYNQTIKKLLIE